MTSSNKLASREKRLRRSFLRKLIDIASHPAMANYTPSGPGSLAIGQVGGTAGNGSRPRLSGGTGGDATGLQWESNAPQMSARRVPDYAYSADLRNFFWI